MFLGLIIIKQAYVVYKFTFLPRWEKDGLELETTTRAKAFESRGVRGLTMRNLKDGDEGLYAVRVTGPNVNLYSSCRVSLTGGSSVTTGSVGEC